MTAPHSLTRLRVGNEGVQERGQVWKAAGKRIAQCEATLRLSRARRQAEQLPSCRGHRSRSRRRAEEAAGPVAARLKSRTMLEAATVAVSDGSVSACRALHARITASRARRLLQSMSESGHRRHRCRAHSEHTPTVTGAEAAERAERLSLRSESLLDPPPPEPPCSELSRHSNRLQPPAKAAQT